MQPVGSMSQQVAVLVHRAALDRHVGPERGERLLEPRRAVDDDQLRRPQAARDEIVEERPPGGSLSPPMFLTASSTFWPSARTPRTTSSEIEVAFLSSRTRTTVPSRISRTIGSSASETGVPGIPVALHLAPDPADRILADRATEQGRQCPPYPARVGAGKIGRGDQRIGGVRAALIGPQRLALPLGRLAVPADDPGTRDGDLGRPECAGQRARPMAVPMAGDGAAALSAAAGLPAPIARPRQRCLQFVFDHRLDEVAHPSRRAVFDRIKPTVEKLLTRPHRPGFVVLILMA